MTADDVIKLLNLKPLPDEGGFFRETYKCSAGTMLPRGHRAYSTAIYYLITPESFSKLHVVAADEVFHFYMGDPVEMLQLSPLGELTQIRLGQDLKKGETLQHAVPAGHYQGTKLIGNGKWALLGCTVAPGFEYSDSQMADPEEIAAKFPKHITKLNPLLP